MTNERVAALTFDLCELETVTTGYDAAVIDYLREEALPATLFLGGKWMRTHAVRTKQLMTDPLFEIGSHAWSHGNFGIMDECAMREQIRWTDAQYAALRETVMREAKTPEARAAAAAIPAAMRFFRLPYGRTSELGLRVLADEGFDVIQWSVSGDSVLDMTPEEEGRATALRVNPGAFCSFTRTACRKMPQPFSAPRSTRCAASATALRPFQRSSPSANPFARTRATLKCRATTSTLTAATASTEQAEKNFEFGALSVFTNLKPSISTYT